LEIGAVTAANIKALPGSAATTVIREPAPNTRLRVLFCLDTFHVGGTELNAVRTLERLVARGIEVHIACLREDGPLRERVRKADVPVHRFRIPSLVSPRAVSEGLRFRDFVRRGGYDVVHAHDMYSNILFVPWARAAGTASVIASRRWWNETPRSAHRILNRWSYRFAHRVLVNSAAIGTLVREGERIGGDRVAVISNFVDEEMFKSPGDAFIASLREELGMPADAIVVGIVANLHPVKEHSVLLDAIARIAPRWPKLRVVLVGEGSCRDALRTQAHRLGIGKHIVFAGSRPHHPNTQFLFDISVLTSRNEGFPNAIVEAMAAGRPVVATAVGGVIDAVREGETGLLVPASKATALATALESLLKDPARRQAMGAAGCARAEQLYDANRVIDSLESLYESLTTSRVS
jgi:glycosyltransferase involved in cell wall biosynthesis